MASTSITLLDLANANQVYSLIGQTNVGASYKDATRSLALPKTLSFSSKVGVPGSLGNDKVAVTLANSVSSGDSTGVSTLTGKLELSIPRDSAVTTAMIVDLLCEFASLLSDANNAILADAMVP